MRIERAAGQSVEKALRRFEWAAVANPWADVVGPVVKAVIKEQAPVSPQGPNAGRLRDSITYEKKTGAASVTMTYATGVPYARYVVDGTVPHLIEPRAAKALHWVDRSGDHFARLVHHPGTRPNPFARRAMEMMLPFIQRTFRDSVLKALEKG